MLSFVHPLIHAPANSAVFWRLKFSTPISFCHCHVRCVTSYGVLYLESPPSVRLIWRSSSTDSDLEISPTMRGMQGLHSRLHWNEALCCSLWGSRRTPAMWRRRFEQCKYTVTCRRSKPHDVCKCKSSIAPCRPSRNHHGKHEWS